MESEHKIPEEATRPQPKKTSLRSAAMLAAGLTIGGGVVRELAEDKSPISPDAVHTTEVQKAAPEKAAEQKEVLRARLESFTWVTGVDDTKSANPNAMYRNKFTPEFIEWLIATGSADEVFQNSSAEAVESFIVPLEDLFTGGAERRSRIQEKMSEADAETHIQFLKDTEILREP